MLWYMICIRSRQANRRAVASIRLKARPDPMSWSRESRAEQLNGDDWPKLAPTTSRVTHYEVQKAVMVSQHKYRVLF